MVGITVRVRNMGSLQGKVKKLNWGIQAGVIVGLRGLAQPIEDDIKQSIRTGSRKGRWVKRYNPERTLQASAPGEVPANDLGMLANSISVDVDQTQFNMTLSASAPHARPLEYGTRHMLPRPFLRPALVRWRQRIIDAIHDAIKRAL